MGGPPYEVRFFFSPSYLFFFFGGHLEGVSHKLCTYNLDPGPISVDIQRIAPEVR